MQGLTVYSPKNLIERERRDSQSIPSAREGRTEEQRAHSKDKTPTSNTIVVQNTNSKQGPLDFNDTTQKPIYINTHRSIDLRTKNKEASPAPIQKDSFLNRSLPISKAS